MTCIFACPIFYNSKARTQTENRTSVQKTLREFDQSRESADKIDELLARGAQKKRDKKRTPYFASTKRQF